MPEPKKEEKWVEIDGEQVLLYPRYFDKCPVCGCKSVYSKEAMKEEIDPKKLESNPPIVSQFVVDYKHGIYQYRVNCIFDTCAKCGLVYTVYRDKISRVDPNILSKPH